MPERDTATPDSIKGTWPKDSLVTKLRASFALCQGAIAQVNDASLGQQVAVTFGGETRKVVRANLVLLHALDMANHYSQVANYIRLNNLLPPTASRLFRAARPTLHGARS